jgi:hypothetical protein
LESLPGIYLTNEAGDLGAILRVNGAGRRYLIEGGSSISKGVEVLGSVNNEFNCVFLYLLKNPRLRDSSAVEIVSTGESNSSRSTNLTVSSDVGKREQARAQIKVGQRLSEELESTGDTVEEPEAVDWLVEEPESAAADRQSLQSSLLLRSDGAGGAKSEL